MRSGRGLFAITLRCRSVIGEGDLNQRPIWLVGLIYGQLIKVELAYLLESKGSNYE